MLDENLPTYYFRPVSNNPLSTILYFTQNGSEPNAEYSLQKLDPALPQAKNKYAVALGDASTQGIIFAEVLVEPEFQQPSLSAAEIRANNGSPPAPMPITPEGFTVQLYNPDQQVIIKGEKSMWMGKESFEFEMPQQTFRVPSASQIDRLQNDPVTNSMTPKIIFKWKRESKFSKDMTCYMTGRSAGGRKSKEPDITVALYQHGRERAITIYEPNMRRVEVEDLKGLEIVLLLSAEVIREIYLTSSRDLFNVNGAPTSRRKSSTPLSHSTGSLGIDPYTMTSGLGIVVPANTNSPTGQQPSTPQGPEARRLQAIAQQEERDRAIRDEAEQRRIKKMLQDEEMARRMREAEVERETEALRRQFGMEGQVYSPMPNLPARPSPHPHLQAPAPPPRPVSVEPRPPGVGRGSWLAGMTPQFFGASQPTYQSRPGRRRGGSNEGKVCKKRSTLF
ncbi:hypothetical protein GGS21DRAFT_524182 [Xylaria nigripes]|nr:hypothetical protein GGS21DRAFT_524182 [Xylaria nigripes]